MHTCMRLSHRNYICNVTLNESRSVLPILKSTGIRFQFFKGRVSKIVWTYCNTTHFLMLMSFSLSQWFSNGSTFVPLLLGNICQCMQTFLVDTSGGEYATGI